MQIPHLGHAPSSRAIAAARARGVDLTSLRARQITVNDLRYYDTIIAMDNQNVSRLKSLMPDAHEHKIQLLLQYRNPGEQEVPDPYYGGDHEYERALDLIEEGCRELLAHLLSEQQ